MAWAQAPPAAERPEGCSPADARSGPRLDPRGETRCANLMAAPVYHAGAAFCGKISFVDDAPFAVLEPWPGRTTVHGEHDVGGRKTSITLLVSGKISERAFAIKML